MPTSRSNAAAVHRRAIIVDSHCDTPYRLLRHEVGLRDADPDAQADLTTLLAGGVTASFFAAYVPPFYADRGAAAFCRRLMALIRREADQHEELRFTDSVAGIRQAKADDKLAILIGIEGGHAIEDSLDLLREFYAAGARYLTLTHVNTNHWCDSSGDVAVHGGLTPFGREVVHTMNDLGMIVDVSHISDQAYTHVLEATRVPVVATHSSCRALCNHPRNMTDAMLRDLASNGGVCMINFFSAFLNQQVAEVLMKAARRQRDHHSPGGTEETPDDRIDWDTYVGWFQALNCPTARFDDAIDHIIHAASVAGIDHVGIGTDFDGVPALPDGLENASRLPRVTEKLLDRGMSEDDVEKVLGGNFLRVFEQVERGRKA